MADLGLSAIAGLVLGSVLIGAGMTALYYRRVQLRVAEEVNELEARALEELDEEDAVGYGVELPPPDVGRWFLDVFRVWLHVRKEARLAKRGYVKWYRVRGGRLRMPKWVKPEHKGGGEYEYTDTSTEITYIFPESAMVDDGVTGAPVAIHQEGEAEPIDLREPGWATMDGSALKKLIDMEIVRSPPGGLSNLPLTPQQLKIIGVGVLFVAIYLGQMVVFGG